MEHNCSLKKNIEFLWFGVAGSLSLWGIFDLQGKTQALSAAGRISSALRSPLNLEFRYGEYKPDISKSVVPLFSPLFLAGR